MDAQKELIHFLLKRLKECALESAAFRSAVFNFTPEAKAKMMEMVEYYRQSSPTQEKVAAGFRDLDSLVQRVLEQPNQEEARRLLEQFDLTGRLVN